MKRLSGTLRAAWAGALTASLCLVTSALAQSPQITSEMNVDSGLLHTWLQSGDPRLVAWAADFARRRHDAGLISDIPSVIQRWPTAAINGEYGKRVAPRRALLALLDALVQEHAEVSIELIQSLASSFPAQSMLLSEQLPRERTSSMLTNWAFPNDFGGTIVGARAHAAAMILARKPDPNFAYHILEGLVQHVTIHGSRQRMGFGGGVASSCGDSFAVSPLPGWPIVYDYQLVERKNDPGSKGRGTIPVVEIGDRTVEAERIEETGGRGGCWHYESDASFRHELLAYWLDVKPLEMPWQPEESYNVSWKTKSAYELELGSILETSRGKMLDTLKQLKARHLFDDRMANGSFPQISVSVVCEIHPCPLPAVSTLRQSGP